MTFRRTQLVDLQGSFPARVSDGAVIDTDLLLVVNGFEERTTRYVEMLVEAHRTVSQAVTIRFATNKSENEATLPALEAGLNAIGATNTFVEMDAIDAGITAAIANARHASVGNGAVRVTFDISGASGRIILRVIRSLFEIVRSGSEAIDLNIAYTEALEYAPAKRAAHASLDQLRAEAELYLGSSVSDTVSVGPDWDADEEGATVEYPGHAAEGLPERAVVICGFNANRVRVALDAVDPAFNTDVPHPGVTYVAGRPPSEALAWRLDVMKEINCFGANPTHFDFTDVSTLEYMETLDALERIYQAGFGNERMTIIPFGSKMQTLAAALFCELHPDVRAQLAAPARYAGSDYSKGSAWTHTLSFGNLRKLADIMGTLGALDLVAHEGAMTGWTTTSRW